VQAIVCASHDGSNLEKTPKEKSEMNDICEALARVNKLCESGNLSGAIQMLMVARQMGCPPDLAFRVLGAEKVQSLMEFREGESA
jgi:hypothetical protein